MTGFHVNASRGSASPEGHAGARLGRTRRRGRL